MDVLPRLALYALLSSLEEDLRGEIARGLASLDSAEALGQDVLGKALSRRNGDNTGGECSIEELLPFVDFADAWQVLNSRRDFIAPQLAAFLRKQAKVFEALVPIRNRVMHSRPFEFEDLPTVLGLVERLRSELPTHFPRMLEAHRRLLEDPAFLHTIELPEHDRREKHNLPLPDFDETGFIGRRDTVRQLVDLCLGPYPVITVVGDGGLGKTAMALKVAYELLDHPGANFDAIVWTSSKTTRLTPNDIVTIEGAISDSLGLLTDVAEELGAARSAQPMDEVLAYLAEFRILLVIDNLETVLDDRIKGFLAKLPLGSKVLITSRIGLGAFEHPVKLERLSDEDAVDLIRALARVRGVPSLVAMDNKRVARFCSRMKNNPLWIKWFVAGVQAGSRPEELLATPDRFLEFSMSNVYGYLDENAKLVLKAMQVVPGRKSQAELAALTELEINDLQTALNQLNATNMVAMASVPAGSSFESQYELADLPRTYLSKKHPVSPALHTKVTKRHRALVATAEQLQARQASQPYRLRSLDLRSAGNLVVAKHLLEALDYMEDEDWEKSEHAIANARRLAPEWYEVHRVEATIKAREGNLTAAQEGFEAALELEPASAPLRLRYGMFLLDHLGDHASAAEQCHLALEIDPHSVDCQLELARVFLRSKDYEAARHRLAALRDRDHLMSQQRLKMYWDLRLQAWGRLADDLSLEGEYERSLRALESLRQDFAATPGKLRDSKIRGRLVQAVPTLKRLIRCGEAEVVERAQELLEWVGRGTTSETQPPRASAAQPAEGVVVKIVDDKGYGFIRLRDGDEVFAHFSQLKMPRQAFQTGARVVFSLVDGRGGGAQAVDVRNADGVQHVGEITPA